MTIFVMSPQPNPLLSNEYVVNENTTRFELNAIDTVSAERALGKMKKSFGFGSDGIASHFYQNCISSHLTISLQYFQPLH